MEVKNIKPLFDRVIVKPIIEENKTSSGIFIPDSVKDKPREGIVMSVGPGKKDEPLSLKTGDKVLFNRYGVTELKFGDDVYFIIRESDVFAVIE